MFFENMVEEGFLNIEDRSKILFSDENEEIEEFIKNYIKPEIRNYK